MYRSNSAQIGTSSIGVSKGEKIKSCNICGNTFRSRSLFQRFCYRCKESEEILRFVDWLPELDDSLVARMSA